MFWSCSESLSPFIYIHKPVKCTDRKLDSWNLLCPAAWQIYNRIPSVRYVVIWFILKWLWNIDCWIPR
jgi:hypothetical protein